VKDATQPGQVQCLSGVEEPLERLRLVLRLRLDFDASPLAALNVRPEQEESDDADVERESAALEHER